MQDPRKKCEFFLWLDPALPNNHYKETLWKLHVDLEEAQKNAEVQKQILKIVKAILIMVVMLMVLLILVGVMLHKVLVKGV